MPDTPDKASEAEKFRTIDIDALIKERDDWKRACEQHLKTISRQISTLSNLPLHAPDADGNRQRWDGKMPWIWDKHMAIQADEVRIGSQGAWVVDIYNFGTVPLSETYPTRELAEQAAAKEGGAHAS